MFGHFQSQVQKQCVFLLGLFDYEFRLSRYIKSFCEKQNQKSKVGLKKFQFPDDMCSEGKTSNIIWVHHIMWPMWTAQGETETW